MNFKSWLKTNSEGQLTLLLNNSYTPKSHNTWNKNKKSLTRTLKNPTSLTATVRKEDITELNADSWKNGKNYPKAPKMIPETEKVGTNNSIPDKNNNKSKNNNNSNRAERKPKTVYPLCETCGKTNHSTTECHFGANAANRPPPRNKRPQRQNQVRQRDNKNSSKENAQAAANIFK